MQCKSGLGAVALCPVDAVVALQRVQGEIISSEMWISAVGEIDWISEYFLNFS
jgi:hypothetical protein